jgi:DNA-binding transcriptional MocR family regulator
LRLSYSFATESDIVDGVKKLGQIL